MFCSMKLSDQQKENLTLLIVTFIIMIIIIIFYSCNTKSKIVKQQEEVKRALDLVNTDLSHLNYQKSKLAKDSSSSMDSMNQFFDKVKKIGDSTVKLQNRRDSLKSIFDSLQFELKKQQ